MKIENYNTYKRVIAEDGYVLTKYKDGDDILNYASCKMIYMGSNNSIDEIREITIDENNQYEELLLQKQNELGL